MSDVPADYIEHLKRRDSRFAVLSHAIAVEADLRDNPTIQAMMAAIRADAEQAMEELCDVSPADVVSISLLLVKIRTIVYVRRTLNTILRNGAIAEQAIRAEDHRESD